MEKINRFEHSMSEGRVLVSLASFFLKLFSTITESFSEILVFLVIATLFSILSLFYYSVFSFGYWIFGFVSEYIYPLNNIVFGK